MTNPLLGFFAAWLMCAGMLVLQGILPARNVAGYVRDEETDAALRYRLNGPLVLVVSVGLWMAAGYGGVMPWDWLWQHRWAGAAGGCVLGLLVSGAAVWTAPAEGRSPLIEFYLGRRRSPRMFRRRVDAKMFLYVFGASRRRRSPTASGACSAAASGRCPDTSTTWARS